jgi:hypothetical protein
VYYWDAGDNQLECFCFVGRNDLTCCYFRSAVYPHICHPEHIMADEERVRIEAEIKNQGERVRKLKAEKAPKEKV